MTESSPSSSDDPSRAAHDGDAWLGDAFTRQVFEALPANIAVIDRGGIVRVVNRKWEEFACANDGGKGSPVGVGANYLEVCRRAAGANEPDADTALRGIEAVLAGETDQFSMEYPCHGPRVPAWYLMSVVPLTLGPEHGAVIAHLNVTERRLAEDRLRRSEQRLRLATEAAGMFSWEADLASGTALWSENAAAMIGCCPDELPGRVEQGHFFVAPEDRERLAHSFLDAVAAHRKTYAVEYRALSALTEAKFFRSDTRILYGETGEPVRLLGVTQNITERRIAEEALRESEDRFRTLADNISQLAWMADETGHVFWFNRRWYEYTGTSLAQMQGWGWRSVHHPDHLTRVVRSWQHSLDGNAPWEDTFPMRGKDGRYRWFLTRALPIVEEGGGVVRWFGTNTDVTAQREAEEEIRRHAEELARANEELRRFNRAVVGRETRMIELKREVNALLQAAGQPPRYALRFDQEPPLSADT